jgi:hypothetical protein
MGHRGIRAILASAPSYFQKAGPTAARLSSGSLADFLARKIWQIFFLNLLLDFLAVGFAYSVNNILSYLNITNLPARRIVFACFVWKGLGKDVLNVMLYCVTSECQYDFLHFNFTIPYKEKLNLD